MFKLEIIIKAQGQNQIQTQGQNQEVYKITDEYKDVSIGNENFIIILPAGQEVTQDGSYYIIDDNILKPHFQKTLATDAEEAYVKQAIDNLKNYNNNPENFQEALTLIRQLEDFFKVVKSQKEEKQEEVQQICEQIRAQIPDVYKVTQKVKIKQKLMI